MTMTKRTGEVVAVELVEGAFGKDHLRVSIRSAWGIKVEMDVPLYRASSYPIGRKVEIELRTKP